MGPLRGATTRVMPQPLGGRPRARGTALLPRLHRGAIPFLGMADAVAVVVQVLVRDAVENLVLVLLFQAGSFISFMFSSFIFPLPSLLPACLVHGTCFVQCTCGCVVLVCCFLVLVAVLSFVRFLL